MAPKFQSGPVWKLHWNKTVTLSFTAKAVLKLIHCIMINLWHLNKNETIEKFRNFPWQFSHFFLWYVKTVRAEHNSQDAAILLLPHVSDPTALCCRYNVIQHLSLIWGFEHSSRGNRIFFIFQEKKPSVWTVALLRVLLFIFFIKVIQSMNFTALKGVLFMHWKYSSQE